MFKIETLKVASDGAEEQERHRQEAADIMAECTGAVEASFAVIFSPDDAWVALQRMQEEPYTTVPVYRTSFTGYSPETTLRSIHHLVGVGSGEALLAQLEEQYTTLLHVLLTNTETALREGLCRNQELESQEGGKNYGASFNRSAFGYTAALWHLLTLLNRELECVAVYLSKWRSGGAVIPSPWSPLQRLATRCLQNVFSSHAQLLDASLEGFQLTLGESVAATASLNAELARLAGVADDGDRNLKAYAALHHVDQATTYPDGTPRWTAPAPPSPPLSPCELRLRDYRDFTGALEQYPSRVQHVAVTTIRTCYETVSQEVWRVAGPRAYFLFVERALADEKRRVAACLASQTLPLLEESVQTALLRPDTLAEALPVLMDLQDFSSLRCAWKLYATSSYMHCGDQVLALFRKYVLDRGSFYMSWLGNPSSLPTSARAAEALPATTAPPSGPDASKEPFASVRSLIDLALRCEEVVHQSFQDVAHEFTVQLHEGLRTVLGQRYSHEFALQLVALLDATMRRVASGDLPLRAPSPRQLPGEGSTTSATAAAGASATEMGNATKRPRWEAETDTEQSSRGMSRVTSMSRVASLTNMGGLSGATSTNNIAAMERELFTSTRPTTAEEVLENIGYIFSDHPHKQYFEARYWSDLAARLMRPLRPTSVEAEEVFVHILNKVCGGSFTSKFEGMLRDIREVPTLNDAYHTWIDSKGAVRVPLPSHVAEDTSSPPTPHPSTTPMDENADEEEEGAPVPPPAPAPPPTNTRLSEGQRPLPALPPPTAADFEGMPTQAEVRLFVLTNGLWPPFTPLPLRLPTRSWQKLSDSIDLFYRHSFRNRCLTWLPQLSHATITGNVRPMQAASTGSSMRPPVPKQFSGTLVQCAALMALDASLPTNKDTITVAQLCQRLGTELEAPEVMEGLRGLTQERFQMLLCTSQDGKPNYGALLPTDRLGFNDNFSIPMQKVQLPLRSRRAPDDGNALGDSTSTGDGEEDEDVGKMVKRVMAERGFIIEATITRYMKSARSVTHEQLLADVPPRLQFPVNAEVIKETIEKLLDKNYLKRDGLDGYTYVA